MAKSPPLSVRAQLRRLLPLGMRANSTRRSSDARRHDSVGRNVVDQIVSCKRDRLFLTRSRFVSHARSLANWDEQRTNPSGYTGKHVSRATLLCHGPNQLVRTLKNRESVVYALRQSPASGRSHPVPESHRSATLQARFRIGMNLDRQAKICTILATTLACGRQSPPFAHQGHGSPRVHVGFRELAYGVVASTCGQHI